MAMYETIQIGRLGNTGNEAVVFTLLSLVIYYSHCCHYTKQNENAIDHLKFHLLTFQNKKDHDQWQKTVN